jgi:hypothetical protein
MLTRSASLFGWAKTSRASLGPPPTLFRQLTKRWRALMRKKIAEESIPSVQALRSPPLPRKVRPGSRVRADYPTFRWK